MEAQFKKGDLIVVPDSLVPNCCLFEFEVLCTTAVAILLCNTRRQQWYAQEWLSKQKATLVGHMRTTWYGKRVRELL